MSTTVSSGLDAGIPLGAYADDRRLRRHGPASASFVAKGGRFFSVARFAGGFCTYQPDRSDGSASNRSVPYPTIEEAIAAELGRPRPCRHWYWLWLV